MWKRRLGISLAILGGVAALLAPAARSSERGGDLELGGVVDIAIGAGLWLLIGSGIGALIDRRRNKVIVPVSAPSPVGSIRSPLPARTESVGYQGDPGWYRDPFGRFEGRYWNGNAWTSNVASGGRTYEDDPSP
jgi:hypothetical protein